MSGLPATLPLSPGAGAGLAPPVGGFTRSVLQVGTYDAATDAFTPVLDLNDGVSYRIHPRGLDIQQPEKTVVRAGNIRTPGQPVPLWQYGNRHITVEVGITSTVSASDLISKVHALQAAIERPPYVLRLALPRASAYTYADVLAVKARIPTDTQLINTRGLPRVQIDFECAPGLRGDRIILDNLVANPGFEQPAGPGVNAFYDTFVNANPYRSQVGGAPTAGSVSGTYVDLVMSDAPLRYWRLGESSGTTAYDISGNGAHATYVGSPTLGTPGAITGDADTAVTLNGTTQTVQCSNTTGLPTGAAALSLACWVRYSANPSGTVTLMVYGRTGVDLAKLEISMNSSGQVYSQTGTLSTTAVTLSKNVWHLLAVTYDGTTVRFYVDGVLQAGSYTCTLAMPVSDSTTVHLGSSANDSSPSGWFAGSVDDAAVYGTALSAARLLAYYNAGASGTGLGTISNVLTIPSGARVAFGSPAWGPLNTWQVRFRWVTGLTARFYLHYTDSSNYLRVSVTNGALPLTHTIAGAANTLASATPALANGSWYWLKVTQFPGAPGAAPQISATLYNDAAGAVGSQVAAVSGQAASDTVALTGQPQLEAAGAALAVGGPYNNVHRVFLFGPGGWAFEDNIGVGQTAWASGAWETDYGAGAVHPVLTTYDGGPVTSYGAARIDAPPAGTWDAFWRTYAGGTTAGTVASPVGAPGNTLGVYAWVKSSGLSAGAQIKLRVAEYDAAGNFLRVGSAGADLTGEHASWTRIGGAYTTGPNCAFVGVTCRALDMSAPGASAGARVWFDNVQCWDATDLGIAATDGAMPYCALRFPYAPAQLEVSGIQGEMPSPALVALGTYYPGTLAAGQALPFVLARRRTAGSTARLIGEATRGALLVLDATAWGGCYAQTSNGMAPYVAGFLPPNTGDGYGWYHLYARLWSNETVFSRQTAQPIVRQTDPDAPWAYYTSAPGALLSSPFRASSVWSVLDVGQVRYPPAAGGVLVDPAAYPLVAHVATTDSSARTERANWHALLPVDGDILSGQIINPTGSLMSLTAQYLWLYVDGLGVQRGQGAGMALSMSGTGGAGAQANPGKALNVLGIQSGNTPNPATLWFTATLGADPYLTLDPTVTIPSGPGAGQAVNQLVAHITDPYGALVGVAVQLRYSPLYLYPRP